jgi:hypothetical protein
MQITPVLTEHARERCREMGISTKVAKWIVLHADVRRPGKPGSDALIATSDEHPGYAVVYAPEQPPLVITVVFRTVENYMRAGAEFVRKP